MTKEQFLKHGFTQVNNDPLVLFEKKLIVLDEDDDFNDTDVDDIPSLFYGVMTVNSESFGVYTGSCLIWLNTKSIEEAVEFSNKILSFEPIF